MHLPFKVTKNMLFYKKMIKVTFQFVTHKTAYLRGFLVFFDGVTKVTNNFLYRSEKQYIHIFQIYIGDFECNFCKL